MQTSTQPKILPHSTKIMVEEQDVNCTNKNQYVIIYMQTFQLMTKK